MRVETKAAQPRDPCGWVPGPAASEGTSGHDAPSRALERAPPPASGGHWPRPQMLLQRCHSPRCDGRPWKEPDAKTTRWLVATATRPPWRRFSIKATADTWLSSHSSGSDQPIFPTVPPGSPVKTEPLEDHQAHQRVCTTYTAVCECGLATVLCPGWPQPPGEGPRADGTGHRAGFG